MNSVVSTRSLLLALPIFGFMLIEARRAARNERAQRARGGIEPAADVYAIMQFVYPGIFAVMLGEGLLRPASIGTAWVVSGLAIFAAAKALKWWAIVTLRSYWTFRVIVVPGTAVIRTGPYRWLRHPNYVAVVGEIVSAAMMTGAVVSGPVSLAVFGTLIWRRITVENRALDAILRPNS